MSQSKSLLLSLSFFLLMKMPLLGMTIGIGSAVISNGVITDIVVNSGGSGFTQLPIVSITDAGGGTGATATPVVSSGSVVNVVVTNGGSGYSTDTTKVYFLPSFLPPSPTDPDEDVPDEDPGDDMPDTIPDISSTPFANWVSEIPPLLYSPLMLTLIEMASPIS